MFSLMFSSIFSSLFSSLSQLHFLEPRWLFAFIPLALILWLFSRSRPNVSSWEKVIDHNLLPYLLQGKETKVSKLPKWLLGVGGFIAIIALANPVWEKIARPVFQTNSARVIVLDLSTSMLINDLKPSRLARARFKIEDILSRNEEGQTGLVVFAGDAFTASPLTRDVDTIRNMLQIFTPRLMPAQGSRVDYGLKKAHELLKQAGVRNGQVLLIADGVSKPAIALREAEALKADGHTLSVLAVGTEKGGLLRLRTKRVNIKLDAEALQKISKKGGGGYHIITSNNTDLNTVLKKAVADNNSEQDKNQTKTDDFKSDDWKSSGPYLLLLLLPIAALAFRKGWLLNLFIVFALSIFIAQPEAVYALDNAETNTKTEQSFSNLVSEQWQKLWLNNEQLADRALKQKHYQQASQLSEAPLRKGSASYKSNDYKEALNAFKKGQGADALYNQGNTLAKMEKYKEAIEAYKKALKAKPNMKDAQINKKAVEDFLKKKKQQEKKKQHQKNQKDKQKDKQNKDDKNKKQQGDKSGDKGKKGKDDAQKKKQGDKQGGKQDGKQGDKNQFDKANKDLAKNKNKEDKDNKENAENAKDADKQKQADEAKAAKEKEAKAKKAKQDKNKAEKAQDESQAEAIKAAKAKAEELSKEEKMAAEQWLRRIPDDPGGLLRRKFRRQYQRNNRRPNDDEQPW